MANDTKQIEPMDLDPVLLRTGETVSRLAIELAKLKVSDGQRPDVVGAVPDAWQLLRRVCLEIETYRKTRTIEDYTRFGIRPPKELLEASKPPPPPPYREAFDTLFNKKQDTIYLPSEPTKGLPERFEWQQLVPWDASQPASAERKTTPYKIVWAVIDSRVRQLVDEIIYNVDFTNQLCSDLNLKWDWDDLPLWTAKNFHQSDGSFDPWMNRVEWE